MAGRIRCHYFTFEVDTGLDLQGIEYEIGRMTHGLEVNVTEISLRDDPVSFFLYLQYLLSRNNKPKYLE